MPLPEPKEYENQDDFIERCKSDPVMKREYENIEQRIAVCYSQWDKRENNKE